MNADSRRQLLIEWEDPSPVLPVAMQMSGLEYMQALIRGEFPAPPIARLMDFYLAEVDDGKAIFKGTPGEQHFNPIGMVHGGFAATLLDSALGCAVHTTLPQGMIYSTAQLNINLTRPIMPQAGELICEASVIHRGSRMVTADAMLKDADAKLYAHGTTTCFVYPIEQRTRT